MCVPKPQESAAPANQVPSMQAADNLSLGGAAGINTANAGLGRLALRINQPPAPAAPAPPVASTTPTSAAASGASSSLVAASGATSSVAGGLSGTQNLIPNLGLRLGGGVAGVAGVAGTGGV